ncbi:MAG: glycosyltransferase family 4 protein [Anaerolineae bacterium]
MSKIAIHQIMPGFLYGDALGNQAAYIRNLLREWGYRSQVYAQFRDNRRADPGLDFTRCTGQPDDVLIYHYSIGSPLTGFVRGWPGKLVVYYHNVTPAHFLRDYNPEMADLLAQGRQELADFKDVPFALAASEYNREEMLELGYRRVEVVPYFIYFDELLESADSLAGREIAERYAAGGWVNLLFVGRIVPNKRQDDLIRAFNYYHRRVNPRSRLLLVGSDGNAPGYRVELEVLAGSLGLEEVHLTGPVGLKEGLGGYFRAADVFLSMSEHEGFCVPLLEAMRFDTPVVAYRAAGVPYALGQAGVLVTEKRYDVVGELIDLLVNDPGLRQQVISGQRRRLQDFAPEATARTLRSQIEKMLALFGS